MAKVLFVYPNKEGYPIIPLGISVLSGILKYYGHQADLFDVTFMMRERFDHKAREKTGVVKKVDVEKYWGSGDDVDIEKEFASKIKSFKPDLIAFTIVENNYGYAKYLFKKAKEIDKSIPIIVGGLFPTVCPDFFIKDENVDIICVGEGEYAMLELAGRLDKKLPINDILNLIVKRDGNLIRNQFHKYYDWSIPAFQDWEIFDKRHLLKPFTGKMWITGFFELSRGCPFNCSYCINKTCQDIFKSLGKYNREKAMDFAIAEMRHMKEAYSLELIFFNDENFLTMSKERLKEFCKRYKEEIGLPFFIMTRADSLLDEERIKMLKEANCATIGIGVESGCEKIRKTVMNKHIPNSIYECAFANCDKHNIRTTANIMIGVPYETEADIMESVEFCKKLKPKSLSLAIFAPYYGTKLREICVSEGYMEDKYHDNIAIINTSILKMPQISKARLEEIYYDLNKLICGSEG